MIAVNLIIMIAANLSLLLLFVFFLFCLIFYIKV